MGETPPDDTAEQLRTRLKELGWTQTELATAIGVSTAVVSRWLSGTRVPSLDMAFRIQNSPVAIPAEAWIATPDAPANDESGEISAADTGAHTAVATGS